MKKVLVIGATSAIASEACRLFAKEGSELYLLARDGDKLARLAEDLRVRGAANVSTAIFDALDLPSHETLLTVALAKMGFIDSVLIAHGTLPDQSSCQSNWRSTEEAFTANLLSPIAFLTWLGNYFAEKRSGEIAVISSVAGDRGRQSNYVYGAAKGGLSRFLEGLRNRLAPLGVSVTTIKPGFVDTPMTEHIPKTKMFASAETVGGIVFKSMKARSNVVYAPLIWFPIMMIISHIPEFIFKKLKL